MKVAAPRGSSTLFRKLEFEGVPRRGKICARSPVHEFDSTFPLAQQTYFFN